MNWERLKSQLEHILDVPFAIESVANQEWLRRSKTKSASKKSGALLKVLEKDGALYYVLGRDGGSRTLVLSVDAALLTPSEQRLVQLAVEAAGGAEQRGGAGDERRLIAELREWIEAGAAGGADAEPPQAISEYQALYTKKVPMLLYGEYAAGGDRYNELKKLLESFFGGELLLIPLMEKEWLVLGPESLITAGGDEAASAEEGMEEALESICSGLHTLLLNEGAGECHVSAYYPVVPAKSLPSVVARLREAIRIGTMQRVGHYIHLPWLMYLDQLLSQVPVADKQHFVTQVFKRADPHLDEEMMQTLETFFDLDCNVSETAKRLFIHRNTLLYRLDKLKQETGLDVRSFNQAVHVRIALQLYKVTKRA